MTDSDRKVKAKSVTKLRDWFVFTSILCSALAFSGYASGTGSSQQAATQTELRVSIQSNAGIAVSYYGLSKTSTVVGFYQGYREINTNAVLLHYERSLVIRFLNNEKHWTSHKKVAKVARTPYTRRNYHEFFTNSLRG